MNLDNFNEKHNTRITNLNELFEFLKNVNEHKHWNYAENIDYSDLPTFGGIEPRDTTAIWSWDENNLIIGECKNYLELIDRVEFAQDVAG
jgi:hypothetical protein